MTPERAKELLPVFAAFSEGKKIQCRPKNNVNWWTVYPPHVFNFEDGTEYRVEPEPQEAWINIYPNNVLGDAFTTREAADKCAGESRIDCILMRQVL
jgi:hypothetical protein